LQKLLFDNGAQQRNTSTSKRKWNWQMKKAKTTASERKNRLCMPGEGLQQQAEDESS
jgi:hypothetical protein